MIINSDINQNTYLIIGGTSENEGAVVERND